ncbi:MAG: RagB/SusD family nutrient uptake outer membrane protein [Bacteroidota bacterium]|nr:RagB/SusD family nutrient uptake outer membrane protein [Bacteroidota bacterium]
MNKYIKYSLGLVFLLFTTSCEDFLDKAPQGVTTQESFPVTVEDAFLATNAVYVTLRNWNFHSGGFPLLDIMSDDAYKGSNPGDAAATVGVFDRFVHTPDLGLLNNWWNALYEGIKRANVVIEYLPQTSIDETLKAQYIAEAKFLRSLFYFDLVRAWGGVQIVESTAPPLNLERASIEETYNFIEAGLLEAIPNLPEKSSLARGDIGRATKGAARSLLAKVYLFRGDFVNAEKFAMEVINSMEYDLEENFANANSVEGENGIESVFEVGALSIPNTEGGGNQYANTQGSRGVPNKGWGFNRPSIDLRAAFEAGDPRQEATIIELGDVIDGILIIGDANTPDLLDNGYAIEIESYNQKVWVPGETVIENFGHNRRLIRYADVLLMAAEALNENNKTDLALLQLNKVRARARQGNEEILPDIIETNKDALRDIILQERRVELALEGHRFWDLVRTGKAAAVLGPLGFIQGKHELLPIPQNQIDLMQGVLKQNANWN